MLTPDDIDGLRDLQEKTDAFTSLVFDWVAPLNRRDLLAMLYDFKSTIDESLEKLEAENGNGD